MIYSEVRVIDGDTIEVKTWPFGLSEVCRIEGIDTDEINTKRGKEQKDILINFFDCLLFHPYVFERLRVRNKNGWKYRARCARGRLLIRVYVWHNFRYVNYADYMKSKGFIKRGSKWNK